MYVTLKIKSAFDITWHLKAVFKYVYCVPENKMEADIFVMLTPQAVLQLQRKRKRAIM